MSMLADNFSFSRFSQPELNSSLSNLCLKDQRAFVRELRSLNGDVLVNLKVIEGL